MKTPAPESTWPHVAGKRMTLSNVLELLLTKSGGEHSSVTLSRNARGETQIEVVVRTGDTGTLATADDAAEKAVELYDRLRELYPREVVIGGDTK